MLKTVSALCTRTLKVVGDFHTGLMTTDPSKLECT